MECCTMAVFTGWPFAGRLGATLPGMTARHDWGGEEKEAAGQTGETGDTAGMAGMVVACSSVEQSGGRTAGKVGSSDIGAGELVMDRRRTAVCRLR
jgi:hypothetical protein